MKGRVNLPTILGMWSPTAQGFYLSHRASANPHLLLWRCSSLSFQGPSRKTNVCILPVVPVVEFQLVTAEHCPTKVKR
ncbi:hypothetical protein BKA70DRAFT_1431075 [Coprinopsis sp. MPI-PUGE-AT-0042]|nr:hypothetical protein BKA70DRAFT_1431075 [Coprinopsis sp. MPI-PUGE-AT-0042]